MWVHSAAIRRIGEWVSNGPKKVFADMRRAGLTPRLLNIGGGYPVRHIKPIPSIEIIGEVVNEALADLPKDIRVMAEPGRYLVSDAAYFVCRVVGTATRNGKRWMYWDAGMFGGVIEVTEGLSYRNSFRSLGKKYSLVRGRSDLRFSGYPYAGRNAAGRHPGRRFYLYSQCGRLHYCLRQQFQRLSVAGRRCVVDCATKVNCGWRKAEMAGVQAAPPFFIADADVRPGQSLSAKPRSFLRSSTTKWYSSPSSSRRYFSLEVSIHSADRIPEIRHRLRNLPVSR